MVYSPFVWKTRGFAKYVALQKAADLSVYQVADLLLCNHSNCFTLSD